MMRASEAEKPVELSVVIAARNDAGTIGQQIQALAVQDWNGEWEFIVVDNGSSDGTSDVVASYQVDLPNLALVDAHSGLGAGYARNRGVARARGRNIAFCDADDAVSDGWVAAMGSALREHRFVAGVLRFDALNPQWLQTSYHSKPPVQLESFEGIFPIAPACNLGIAREVFEAVGGFDETFLTGQDLELCLRVWAAGIELTFEPRAVVQYRYRPTLSALWRRSRQYGRVGPALARRLADLGFEAPPRFRGLRNFVWLIRRLPTLRTKAGRARWVVVAASKWGRIEGSIRHRVVYF